MSKTFRNEITHQTKKVDGKYVRRITRTALRTLNAESNVVDNLLSGLRSSKYYEMRLI